HCGADTTAWTVEQINAVDGLETEYFQIVDGRTCQPVAEWADTDEPVGCVTVYAGDVRLIDNIKF
ncbi:MAG: pantoate--beta-alanine ligase, partial [Muribaculaceae bacterium]|nr:pantoate--beta-alanine ligase [Muribaculaceae bacterium]